MSVENFYRKFQSELETTITERTEQAIADKESFPSRELVFAEMVMEHIEAAGLCEPPTICHWTGQFRNANLRITGYALSSDNTALDLFVTHYLDAKELTNLRNSDIIAAANKGLNFLLRAADQAGGFLEKIDPTNPVRDLVTTIRSLWADLDQVRFFVITDGRRTQTKRFLSKEVRQKMVTIEAMDMERLFRHTEGKPQDELSLSFVQAIGRPLPCVHVPNHDADYDYALTAIPGQIIHDLYLHYGPRLLEINVRAFLGSRRVVNKGIVETLRKEPEHFLAYNNGLVLVCDKATFERSKDGNASLSFLKGLQIVNGGQTTSAIYFASRDDPTIDLSHVMIPAKIIILKSSQEESRERLISNVSRYANSQNAVRMSDLSSNRSFHIQIEKLADETWCPDGATRWFYERAAGAYNVLLLREGTTPAKRRNLREITPPKRKLTKNDIAKYHEAWRKKPNQVALAGEKNFAAFMFALDEDPTIVPNPLDVHWYRSMIAKVILFKAIESMIKTKEAKERFRQGWINIATYVVAVVSDRLGNRLDLVQIWNKQGISTGLHDLLWNWAIAVNNEFIKIAAGQQFSEVAKRSDTWEKIKVAEFSEPDAQIPELKGNH